MYRAYGQKSDGKSDRTFHDCTRPDGRIGTKGNSLGHRPSQDIAPSVTNGPLEHPADGTLRLLVETSGWLEESGGLLSDGS